MRILKTFTIDVEFVERLKNETNQSELINGLIGDYYKKRDFNDMTKAQIKAEIEVIKLQKETDKQIKELRKNAI